MENILLITIDCLRKDCVTQELMPNIYELKKKGLTFENVITHGSHTRIAFLSMFASVVPFNNAATSLPSVLKKYGYKTIGVTSQPQIYQSSLNKLVKDFDHMNSLNATMLNFLNKTEPTGIAYKFGVNSPKIYNLGRYLYKKYKNIIKKNKKIKKRNWSDAKNLNNALYGLANKDKIKEPYFIWVHYLDPHWPYIPPKEYIGQKIDNEEISKVNRIYKNKETPYKINEEVHIKARELYSGEVRYIDFRINELISFLEEQGLMKNTITLITADHGEEFFDHGGIQHGRQLYEELVNVPFIVHGYEKQGKINGQRGHINLAPTILDLLDLPEEESFQGESMFKGSDNEIVMKTAKGKLGIRTEQWKYISPGELYNLREDPKEKINVAEGHAELVRKFEKKLEPYRKEEYKEEEIEHEEVKERLKALGYLD